MINKVSKNPESVLMAQDIENLLKKAGIQPTTQRIAICRYVLAEAKHVTVEQIKEWADLNFPKISLATVYNTINILVGSGLVKALKLPHSEKVIYDNNLEEHFHFLDEKTGELHDIYPGQIDLKYSLCDNFKINSVEVLIRGTIT